MSPASSSSSEEASTDFLDVPDRTRTKRDAVSAEPSSAVKPYKPVHHAKSDQQRLAIRKILNRSFLFATLDEKQQTQVLEAMADRRLSAGSELMAQGEQGHELYLIESGELDVFKAAPGAETCDWVNLMTPGTVVGELALLYSSPRAATVIAKTDCTLWALDRGTFRHLVLDAAVHKRQKICASLKRVELLKELNDRQIEQLADALKERTEPPGATVITQGETGDEFFLLIEGKAEAVKGDNVVHKYKAGDYFGELALLNDAPRAATVRIAGDKPAKILTLDRPAFHRLLGPLQTLMKAKEYSSVPIVA